MNRPLTLAQGQVEWPAPLLYGFDAGRHQDNAAQTALVGRFGTMRQSAPGFAFWMQLRGASEIETNEGRFHLRRGSWLALDTEAGFDLQANRQGVAVGLLLSHGRGSRGDAMFGHGLFPGCGQAARAECTMAFSMWRTAARNPHDTRNIRPLLLQLRHLQRDLHALTSRCPGRTVRRKQQVLARMQRARLMLHGNAHRTVSLGELAALSQFSEWWLSKTYRAVYQETVQQSSIRLRLERARALLAGTSLSINEVCAACGFMDPCSFARMFKNWHGQTASQWRRSRHAQHQASPSDQHVFSPVQQRCRSQGGPPCTPS